MGSFYLAGHSFGGYIAGNYAVKYPQYIKKLLLISPIGIRVPPDDENW
jgi:pimeloyl-ACP methyl ester carboxylesterase